VPYGDWVCREITPPESYVLNDKFYPVSITEDGAAVKIEIPNQLIRGSIEGLKLDEDGRGLAGALKPPSANTQRRRLILPNLAAKKMIIANMINRIEIGAL